MQTTYRLNVQEIGTTFLKSLKTLFAGHEVEIIVKTVDRVEKNTEVQKRLLAMIQDNRQKAPVIAHNVDIRGLIDEAQNPAHQ